MSEQNQYTEDNIRSLDWKEHIRMRPGMYIGKLGDGSSPAVLHECFGVIGRMFTEWLMWGNNVRVGMVASAKYSTVVRNVRSFLLGSRVWMFFGMKKRNTWMGNYLQLQE